MLGSADFDLAKYVNNDKILDDKLPLLNCTVDPKAYIEIVIKAKSLDPPPQQTPNAGTKLPGNSFAVHMPVIEERESE